MQDPLYCSSTLHHFSTDGPIPLTVDILNARKSKRAFSVWDQGFECAHMPSIVTDWTDRSAINSNHYAEISDWARTFTGCDKVLFFPAIIRNPTAAQQSSDYAPIEFAHSDYTEAYADMIKDSEHPYHAILQPFMESAHLSLDQLAHARRILTLQLWRNVGAKLMDHPLAVCDATTVPRAQLTEFRVESYGGIEAQFDSFVMAPPAENDANNWYCYPEMDEDEVLIFRAFDSDRATTGQPFWTPHSAFRDPNSKDTPRSSIEMRAICIFL